MTASVEIIEKNFDIYRLYIGEAVVAGVEKRIY